LLNLAWLTNGWNGLANIPPPWIATLGLDSDHTYYYVVLAVAVAIAMFTYRLQRSTLGRGLAALRDDEMAAGSVGISPIFFKLLAFGLSAAYAGIAGSLHAHLIHFISPEEFTIDTSIAMLTMIVLGGMGSLPGAVVGGAAMTLLPEWLRFLELYRKLLYGLVIIIVMVFLPRGLVSIAPRFSRLVRSTRQSIRASLDTEGMPGA
jgi:branched-chain amino acid transport system permease protein